MNWIKKLFKKEINKIESVELIEVVETAINDKYDTEFTQDVCEYINSVYKIHSFRVVKYVTHRGKLPLQNIIMCDMIALMIIYYDNDTKLSYNIESENKQDIIDSVRYHFYRHEIRDEKLKQLGL